MNNFKLIAIRPREGCSKDILKNLKEDQYYFFDNTYEPTEDDFIQKRSVISGDIPNDFFYTKNSNTSLESITIQAVVGKNGEGKSSLIELVIRVLNNFTKHFQLHEITKDLIFVNGLRAELYFSVSKSIYQISIDYSNNNHYAKLIDSRRQNSITNRDFIATKLFFLFNINYSLYALNSEDYYKENLINDDLDTIQPWIDKLFYKNDGYQTPISLHPFRELGNIDVNREKELLDQRLVNLILTEESYVRITENLEVDSYEITFSNSNPLLKEITNIIGNKNFINTNDTHNVITFKFLHSKYIESNLNSIFTNYLLNFIEDWERNEDFEVDEDLDYVIGTDEDKIRKFIKNIEPIKVLEIKQLWDISNSLEQNIEIPIDFSDQLSSSLFQYLIIKSTKILKKYPKYKRYRNSKNFEDNSKISNFIKDLLKDTTHVSIKWKQAYLLLKLIEEYPNCDLINHYRLMIQTESLNRTNQSIRSLKSMIEDATKLIKNNAFDRLHLNPSSIFTTKIWLKSKINLDNRIHLRSLSSGEYQKIGIISSIIYHIKNLDSVERDDNLNVNNYENVVLILDEIELYFHPEYQRTFIKDLIFKISEIKFKRIKSINILFVTHSPFILSDIPKNNVMFLEKGKQAYPISENTFGANIHTLLQHGFFLNSVPIGEFAKDKINDIFDTLHNKNPHDDAYHDIEQRILLVSEPFIKSQLLKLYHERKPQRIALKDDIYVALMNRINYLEKRLDDIDNQGSK